MNPLTPQPPLPNGRGGDDFRTRGLGAKPPMAKNHSPSTSEIEGEAVTGEGESTRLVGEVVEASTTEFLAQALALDSAPAFGAFVEVAADDGMTVYGVVAHVQTAGIDPGSRAIMRGHGDVRDERIYEENPDLPLVLRTTFRALAVGFSESRRFHQFLPPRPPRLHYSVSVCANALVREFTGESLDYLHALLNATDVPVDELLAANLRYTASCHRDATEFLTEAGRELAQLLRADYARLTGILRRCLMVGELA